MIGRCKPSKETRNTRFPNSKHAGGPPLPRGHTVYEVRIEGEGKVAQVDGRLVHGNADLGFRLEDATSIEAY